MVFAESGYAYEQAGDICHALNDYFGAVAFSTNSTLLGPIWWHIGLLFEKNGSRCGHPNFGGWSELSNPAAMAFAIAHTLGYFPLNTGSNTSSLKCAAIASTLHESSAIDRTVKTWREVYRTAGGDRFSRSLLQTAKLPATENEARQRICVRAQTYDDYDSEAAYHGCSGPLPWLLESPGHHGPTGFFVVPTERRTYLIVHLYSAKFIGGDQRQSVQVQTSPETILVHYVMSSVWCPACRPSRAFDVPLLKRGYQWHHVDLHSTSTGKILRSFWWQDIAGHPLALTLLDEGRSVGMKGLECEQTVAVK